MKKYLVLALVGFFASGCSSVVTKNFKVFTDPPDSVISVVSGVELKKQRHHSPAAITAGVPKDPALAAKAILEVSKDNYKPTIISLRDIKDGDTINVKLEKILKDIIRYRLTYRLITPSVSQELQYRDKTIDVSFTVGEQWFQMRIENVSSDDIKILWEQAEYTDAYRQQHRLMHSGIRYPDRNNPIPGQIVPSRGTVREAVIPISSVHVSQQKKGYDIKPLFPIDSEAAAGLKGKTFILFIPVEINRQIIPYNFRIEIIDSVKETIKG